MPVTVTVTVTVTVAVAGCATMVPVHTAVYPGHPVPWVHHRHPAAAHDRPRRHR